MITEDYCSRELCELLKNKGFDEEIETLIRENGDIYHLDENSMDRKIHTKIKNSKINPYSTDVSCPTHQMALKWLREIHNIFIGIEINPDKDNTYYYQFDVVINNNLTAAYYDNKYYVFYEDCVNDAIEFALNQL